MRMYTHAHAHTNSELTFAICNFGLTCPHVVGHFGPTLFTQGNCISASIKSIGSDLIHDVGTCS